MLGLVLLVFGCLLFFNRVKILDYQENVIRYSKLAFKREVREIALIVVSIFAVIIGLAIFLKDFL